MTMTPRSLFLLHCVLLCSRLTCTSSVPLFFSKVKEESRENQTETKQIDPHFNVAKQIHPHIFNVANTPVQDGLTFTRNIKHLNASFHLDLEGGHCKSHDKYGDNICHYDWGEQVLGNYTVETPRVIQHGDKMTGSFHIDYVVPYEFSCLLCGEPCIFEIPVLDITRTLEMPPCPVGPYYGNRLQEQLMTFSPTGGIKTRLEGTVKLITNKNDTIAEFSVSAYVK
jgi:hypothetical protein